MDFVPIEGKYQLKGLVETEKEETKGIRRLKGLQLFHDSFDSPKVQKCLHLFDSV